MSYALRHGASKMALQMNSDGFVFVEELLAHKQFHSFSLEDVERVVVTDLELRAVALDDPDYPREAVHGSYMKHWPSIHSQGISRMNRTHIHLAPALPGDGRVISGMRQSCDRAVWDSIFWSENGVLLTPGDAAGMLPPCYFYRAQRLKTSLKGTKCQVAP
uniref:2'-phosphotransferase n=1 Tax=Cyprinus carpio TaxID=7962 RepID=A0A8C2KWN2_CYPCA